MLKRSAVLFSMAVALSSCATVPAKNPQAEIMVVEANAGLDALQNDFKEVYTDLGEVLEKIALMMAKPGWQEMEQIIRASTSGESRRNGSVPGFDTETALNRWGEKWNDRGEEVYAHYLSLVEQCAFLEVRRIALRMRLRAVEIKMVHALAMEATAKRVQQQRTIENNLNDLEVLEKEINAYELNDLGLYEPSGARDGPGGSGNGPGV